MKVYLPVLIIGGISWIIYLFLGQITLWQLVLNLSGIRVFFDGNQEIWFVALILVCYLLFPYIYAFIFKDESGISVLLRTAALMLLVMILVYSVSVVPSAADTYKRTEIVLTRFPVFLLGCGLGKFVYEKRRISVIGWIVLAALCFCGFVLIEKYIFINPFRRWTFTLAGAPLVFLLALMMSKLPEQVRAAFRFLGQMSLELYVMHTMLRNFYIKDLLFFKCQPGSWKRYLLMIALSIALSYPVLLFEKRIQRLIKKN